MKVAIMQPYFLPYLGYFALINAVDEFILFDTPQFIRHGWIERNRVLKLDGEPMYIKVPLIKHPQDTPINKVEINNRLDWRQKLKSQLVHYKKKAPYYKETITLLDAVLDYQTTSITKFNEHALKTICSYLDINTPIKIWSEMQIDIDEVNAPDDWALHISKKLNANTYINLPGGHEFFNKEKFIKKGIELKFLKPLSVSYPQFYNYSVTHLSIIDVLMFCKKEEIQSFLKLKWV